MKLVLSTLAWTILCLAADIGAASAQQAGRIYRIGWLQVGYPGWVMPPMENWTGPGVGFRDALRDRGYVPGKNIVLIEGNVQGDISRLAAEAQALVAAKVDVIVALGTPPTVAAMQATKTIPIVFPGVGTPVEKGIVASLAHPGGNVTGIAVNVESPKMWQLLRDVAPATRHAGYLSNLLNSHAIENAADIRAKALLRHKRDAAAVGIEFFYLGVKAADEIEPKFAEMAGRSDAAIFIASDDTLFSWRTSIMAMASRHRLVTACAQDFRWAAAGCVLTYGEDPVDRFRRGAEQVVKILKGAKPAEIPVEQPTTFKLIINTKSATALGLSVPPALLALADEVIE